ncbi:hypothetical protein ND861_06055 [Leptospira sp. 2 VSF19]|uniref:Uncharacterized protein n=1 Tax=Leptospira soteropolitanensis TaxID=2950025 RepID=A0ABT3MG92_9LEPT|nr:hypothetical protein [Leptospira soteropolitanensis]MCW7492216.1 hypothetical protein [Leptospira soteropolitanensis]MCW7499798.1 hypothetical protein [Leptospira soteropolitanensis]MCW7522049.1 hypothetical protein [Leptospira soteropolitanensis]MCW7525903.1 hypothetical protein [Leptospira soteropolitanensis]
MSPLFFNQNPNHPFYALGKLTSQRKDPFFFKETNTRELGLQLWEGNRSQSKTRPLHTTIPNHSISLQTKGIEKENQIHSGKSENRLRWAQWMAVQSDSKSVDVSDLKPLWNYLLGETGFSDLLSYIDPDAKESLQMVVEPKNKGLVLYVYWESKETGAMGIQFHYDPEKEKPIFVQLTTERSFQGEDFTKSFANLIRDFPQIRSVQMEIWKDESFNGDYR